MGGGNDTPEPAQPVQRRLIIAGDEKGERVRVVCDFDDLFAIILSLSTGYQMIEVKKHSA